MRRRPIVACAWLSSVFVATSVVSACQGHAPDSQAESSSALEQASSVPHANLHNASWRLVAAPYALSGATSTALADGRVLVTGGSKPAGDISTVTNEAYLFAPKDDTWTPLPPMHVPRTDHTATRLLDGRVLVFGGHTGGSVSKSSELFDPISSTWARVDSEPETGRFVHTASLLPNGKVLVVGGYWDDIVAKVHVYDPESGPTGTWSEGPPLEGGRVYHAAAVRPDGTVFISGGYHLESGFEMKVATNL